jgi:hypothetical protein
MSILNAALAFPLMLSAPTTVAQMKWERRVVIVSAPAASDLALAEQRRILADWRSGGEDRDLAVVSIVGDRVTGATDGAAALRRAHRLDPARFGVVLVGKDGGDKLRSSVPLSADRLRETIDAMLMRHAGQR